MPANRDLVRIAFASGHAEANAALIARVAAETGAPLLVVSEFEIAPEINAERVPWHVHRSYQANLSAIKTALGERRIESASVILEDGVPLEDMRRAAQELAANVRTFDDSLRPVSTGAWRVRRLVAGLRSERSRKWMRRIFRPWEAEIPIRARLAQVSARRPRAALSDSANPAKPLPSGVSIVIPSRDGRDLLARLLPCLLTDERTEIIVSDNGSSDGTADWLSSQWPQVHVVVAREGLSFSKAVNAGIAAARFNRILLLNNDMVPEAGFVHVLDEAFDRVPDLFCATAQIFFEPGVRREETGKAVWRKSNPLDLPLRCDEPLPGEDLTWVLYGSGGCSLFDAGKLGALGNFDERYDPAYVEDLDIGYRAWKRGWPSVYCAGARVEHRHRATTTRFYSSRQLDAFVEINFLKFLILAVGDAELFRCLWSEGVRRLQLLAGAGNLAALDALRAVPKIGPQPPPAAGSLTEEAILALGSGDVAVFPGKQAPGENVRLIVSPYLPFPLSHGGAVRIYNLMRASAERSRQILITFCDDLVPPAPELLAICSFVVLVRRHGSHYRYESARPDVVEEFDSASMRAAITQAVLQWKPAEVQLEYTWMAQYAAACRPARTILVEHDITVDLQEQLLARNPDDFELKRQLPLWKSFETAAWAEVDCVVTMSKKDAAQVTGARQVLCVPNGVDTERFRPSAGEPEAKRLLFIGSFAHLPNVLALEYFLREIWPGLDAGYRLHVIAGHRLDLAGAAGPLLNDPRIELDGFVPDPRLAYTRAEQVIAPLTASAGTNIKILEAMAMGRVVVSTPAGINGLYLSPGEEVLVEASPEAFAAAIRRVSANAVIRKTIEARARETALRFDWKQIAAASAA